MIKHPLALIYFNQVKRLCVSFDGHNLHMQTIVDSGEEPEDDVAEEESVRVTFNLFFRDNEEGAALYCETMRSIRNWRQKLTC